MTQQLAPSAPAEAARIAFDNSYARLPERFFELIAPTAVCAPRLIKANRGLAERLRIDPDWLESEEGVEVLAGNRIPEGAEPLAMAYAGHQFGGFVPQLGDGRAILLGEVIGLDGERRDLHLKGAGKTKFSRGGDGRAWIGPVLREYMVSEAMATFGIPTTRALAAVTTGEPVVRERELPGAVFARVASSHVRVGTFELFAVRSDADAVQILAEYVTNRHYPEAHDAEQPYRTLLDAVIKRQAELIAQWLLVGFIHGVMNTDNMAISGETIDYGPCAFMDEYDPTTVFSSIDHFGRYAYENQPSIAHWNLHRLAECFLPLLSDDGDAALAQAEEALAAFPPTFERAYEGGLRRKLGLQTEEADDVVLGRGLLEMMHKSGADFTNTFRALGDAAIGKDERLRGIFDDSRPIDEWLRRWRQRLAAEEVDSRERQRAMRAANPAYIPRNHTVEAVIRAALNGDYTPFEEMLGVVTNPFEEQAEFAEYAQPPREEERVRATFCGT